MMGRFPHGRRPIIFASIFNLSDSAFPAHLGEALAAVHRTVSLGLKGNLGFAAASSADSGEILARATGSGLAGIAASLAALRLILEAALSIELLLTSGKHELLATLFAN